MREQATSWSSCPSRAEEGGFDGAVEAAGASTSNQLEKAEAPFNLKKHLHHWTTGTDKQ